MAGKAVSKKGQQSLAVDDRPDWMKDEGSRGQEGVGVDDLTIPRLSVVQDLSPQRKKNAPEYIEGADSGMLFNTVSGELYGTDVQFVPCFYRKEWCIWKKVDAGGGFCGAYPSEAAAKQEWGEQGYNEEEYEINDTGQQFGMIVHGDGRLEEIVISMSKSKRKVDRQLNTMIKVAGGDRFSRVYKVSAVEDQNNAGQDYYNFGVHPLGFVGSEEIYRTGEKMYESISAGVRDVNRDPEGTAPAEF